MTALAVRPPDDEAVLLLVQRSAGLLAELECAEGLEDVLQLHEQASALSALARAARVGLEQQNQISSIRIRAQHKAGTLLRSLGTEPRPGRAKRPRGRPPAHGKAAAPRPQLPPGLLHEHGITGQESHVWQAIACVSIDDIVRRIDELQALGAEVTSTELYRLGRSSLRRRSSRQGASPTELRLRAALTNLMRIRALTNRAEGELAEKIVQRLRVCGVAALSGERADLSTIAMVCMLCGRERGSRCQCGGAWAPAFRQAAVTAPNSNCRPHRRWYRTSVLLYGMESDVSGIALRQVLVHGRGAVSESVVGSVDLRDVLGVAERRHAGRSQG
jgi:hypothetical protein